MELLLEILLTYGPYALVALAGILIPADKVPLLKKFVSKLDDELEKEDK
jgi:hypothetical protein